MFSEFEFEDIIFGVFPKVGSDMVQAYGFWAKNSVGDIVQMILQMLEVSLPFASATLRVWTVDFHLIGPRFYSRDECRPSCECSDYFSVWQIHYPFLHVLQDVFRDNFLIQWHPESLLDMTVSPSRPRVFLIDFETAVAFPPELTMDECVVTGYPMGDSFSRPEMYSRPLAPEFSSGKAYSPFKLDVWQLGNTFSDFKVRADHYCFAHFFTITRSCFAFIRARYQK